MKTSSARNVALARAVRDNDAPRVRFLLFMDNADPNYRLPVSPYTPLLSYAVAWGHTRVAKLLLDAGANPRVRGWCEEPPLHCAMMNDDAEMVNALLGAGAVVTKLTRIIAEDATREVHSLISNE